MYSNTKLFVFSEPDCERCQKGVLKFGFGQKRFSSDTFVNTVLIVLRIIRLSLGVHNVFCASRNSLNSCKILKIEMFYVKRRT